MNQYSQQEWDLRVHQWNVLREMVFDTFPDEPFKGTIIAGGDYPPATNIWTVDDDLCHWLRGRRWTDVPSAFIARHPGDFVLLTAAAFANFIPAWLLYSLDNNNQGGEFVAYTFAPRDSSGHTQIRPLSIEMFQALTLPQRETLLAFLMDLAKYHPDATVAEHATAAVGAVDNLMSVFEPGPR